MKIHYAQEAIQDLQRLREFIADNSPVAAQRIARELMQGIDRLKLFPKMGIRVMRAPYPELIRDLFVGHYTVRYLIGHDEIFVLRVWHGKEIEKDL